MKTSPAKLRAIETFTKTADTLRDDVFQLREPEDDELRQVQGLLSEVRDLLRAAEAKEKAKS